MLYIGRDTVIQVHRAEPLPAIRFDASLFLQLAPRYRLQVRFSRHRSAAWNFPAIAAEGISPLSHQHDIPISVQRDDADGRPHLYDAVDSRVSVGPEDGVFPQAYPRILIGDARGERFPGIRQRESGVRSFCAVRKIW